MSNQMRTVNFRPLRRIKKTGKIVVASYSLWRSVRTADYNKFILTIDEEYKGLPPDEFVYNHNGELLFFFEYNPADVPVYHSGGGLDWEEMRRNNKFYAISWEGSNHVSYSMHGADCDGVPTFSHWTADHIANHWKEVNDLKPLMVKTVRKWFGWFLYQLDNSYLNKK